MRGNLKSMMMVGWLVCGLGFSSSTHATEYQCDPTQQDGLGKCGGDVPVPFDSLNRKVELAEGEFYALVGVVEFHNGKPFLRVDFNVHPWLKNHTRKEYPYYALLDSPSLNLNWLDWKGKQVKTVFLTRSWYGYRPDGTFQFMLRLEPKSIPETYQRR